MKLFQRLLIAPAALGLLAPVAANAGEFSSATKLTGGSVFTTGFEDLAAVADNKLTSEYNFTLDLNSSFTGSDNLYVGLEAGNQGDLNMDSQVSNNATNGLDVISLFYSFPVGKFDVAAGPLMDQDDVISATTSIYSDAFRLAAMPYGTVGTSGAGAAISYTADSGWNGSFNLISTEAADSTQGAFTLEGLDIWTASVGYDADNYGGGIIYTSNDNGGSDNEDTSVGVGVYFRPDNFPTISVSLDKLDDKDAGDSTDLMIGLDYEVGPGTASAALQSSQGTDGHSVTNYEVYYNYPVNDGVAIQGGIFSEEVRDADNTEGIVVETFFSF